MKYLLLGDESKTLFIEDDEQLYSIRYNPSKDEWCLGGSELWDNRVGFDSLEPEDSPYRYGNSSCVKTIIEISHEEAEAFASKKIDENGVRRLLKQIRTIKNRPIYD
jgi:hypothetical protein